MKRKEEKKSVVVVGGVVSRGVFASVFCEGEIFIFPF